MNVAIILVGNHIKGGNDLLALKYQTYSKHEAVTQPSGLRRFSVKLHIYQQMLPCGARECLHCK